MDLEVYRKLLGIARRHVRVASEAEDLLQDALTVAVEQGRMDMEQEVNQKWIAGVIRNLAAMQARSAGRKRTRDAAYAEDENKASTHVEPADVEVSASADSDAREQLLQSLTPALRAVAVLILHGLNRDEIRTLLKLSDATFRQRLSAIRRALGPLPEALQQKALAIAYAARAQRSKATEDLPIGLVRRALLHQLNRLNAAGNPAVGTHDPSGHLLVIASEVRQGSDNGQMAE